MLCLTVLLGPLLLWARSALCQDCEVARMKCAYRSSCARALHSYMVDCADVLAGRTSRCPWACKRALISLTSSEAGLALSNCECADDNEFCRRSKERVEVCRPEVSQATAANSVVACSVAQWICEADPLCHTALDYYHRLCKSLFHGRKCTPRCNNSLAILDRQDKAFKLRNCYCDGSEDFPCFIVKENTQKLCYGREGVLEVDFRPPTTTQEPGSGSESSARPCGALLLLSGLLLLLLRTSDSVCVESEESSGCRTRSPVADCDCDCGCSQEVCCRKSAMSTSIVTWPWWWTSEVTS